MCFNCRLILCAVCCLQHVVWGAGDFCSWLPLCPRCRGSQVIAIANDITHNSGAFGPREDAVFRAATELALAERLPLVYLAANSGARVGLSAEVKAVLQARTRPVKRTLVGLLRCGTQQCLCLLHYRAVRLVGKCTPGAQIAATSPSEGTRAFCAGGVDQPSGPHQGLPVHVPV